MKKVLILVITIVLASTSAWGAACTQKVEKNGKGAILTFVCTAVATAFTSTTLSAANFALIKGFLVSEVKTSPGTTPPTNATTVVINTADSPAQDMLAGRGTCSATATTSFLPVVDTGAAVYGKKVLDGPMQVVISGNSVASAVVTVRVLLWQE